MRNDLITDPAGKPMNAVNAALAVASFEAKYGEPLTPLARNLGHQVGLLGLGVERLTRAGVMASALASVHNKLDELEQLVPALRAALPPRPADAE